MKTLASFSFVTATLFLTASCDSQDFKVGDCVQQPDSMIVWEITGIQNGALTLQQDQHPKKPSTTESSKGKGWIKTECL